MDLPSSAHFLYIPGVLILGTVLGFIWGAKATREAFVIEAKRAEERAQRKAKRAIETAAEKAATSNEPPSGS
jgi:hypothetical protein